MTCAVSLGKGRVATPHVVADQGHVADGLHRPAAVRHIARHLVQEVRLEDGVVRHEVLTLRLVLRTAEVRVLGQLADLSLGQSAESFIPSDLVRRRHLHGALRQDVAVVLNYIDHEGETIELGQVQLLNVCLGVLLFGRVQRIALGLLGIFSSLLLLG